ncbi:hypothetical protein BDM02DRAFT_3186951 [Thelephora ganbajun]|uniref:Uncharacterized protein n=1 Tax=Thelephora ganbajun TaxID=370292 RepID=A0ACB6ZGC3_THEGA|nr:hypothetical protein BDM02DRAFT_3186951 [Thelephora ganbajun]
MSEKAFELKFLSHESEDAVVASILQLSNSIFNPESESRYASFEEWKRRLSDPASSIVYLVHRSGRSTVPPPPVAFLFAHPRSHPEPLKNGSSQSSHIWLTGVSEEYRGRGCLDTMVDVLIDLEQQRRGSELSSMPTLTVCTVPAAFPSMWTWLRARTQWALEKELDGGKVLLSLTGRHDIQ